ncbi:MAG: hypothetical protein ACR2KP_07885 [Egibacteraceae bacterium]
MDLRDHALPCPLEEGLAQPRPGIGAPMGPDGRTEAVESGQAQPDALINEVVYRALSAERQASLHGRVGEALERALARQRRHGAHS